MWEEAVIVLLYRLYTVLCTVVRETGDPARLPAQVAGRWGHINEIVHGEETKYFVLGRPKQPRGMQDKSLLYQHDEPNEPTKEGFPVNLYSLNPHSPQFQQSAEAKHLWSGLGCTMKYQSPIFVAYLILVGAK